MVGEKSQGIRTVVMLLDDKSQAIRTAVMIAGDKSQVATRTFGSLQQQAQHTHTNTRSSGGGSLIELDEGDSAECVLIKLTDARAAHQDFAYLP